jgi:DNA-binding transcriptional LysR family regulator
MADPKKNRTHNVNLQAMEVFCEVVRLRSFSRGAVSFGLTQSAASQIVGHLEDTTDVRLIDRQSRPLRPTPEGQTYYQGCLQLLHGHRSLVERLEQQHSAIAGSVRVVSVYSIGLYTLNQAVQRFMQQNAGATVRLEYYHPLKVYGAVLEDEAEVGVVSYPKGGRQFEVLPWLDEAMALACPPGHPLAENPSISIRDLDGHSFVAFDADLEIRRAVDRLLRHHHVSVEIVSEFDYVETIKQALEISGAVSLLPRPSFEREVERGNLVDVKLADVDLHRPVGIIHKKRKKLSPTAQRFIDSLRSGTP